MVRKIKTLVEWYEKFKNVKPTKIIMNPSDLAFIREELKLDYLTELKTLFNMKVIVDVTVDRIIITHED
jgi:hypothetical protein